MNKYMKQILYRMGEEERERSGVPTFYDGFEACHDILLPLLKEALAELRELVSTDDALIERIKQVVEED